MIDILGLQRRNKNRQAVVSAPKVPESVNDLGGFAEFYIDVNINMDTLKEWSPQKITDFFEGIAKVVHARGNPKE